MAADGTGNERRSQWLRGVLDLCVLALVARQETHGYQLNDALRQRGFDGVKGGTLYPLLLRLERQGLVSSTWAASDLGPARKYYRLTRQGRRALGEERAHWQAFTAQVDAILAE